MCEFIKCDLSMPKVIIIGTIKLNIEFVYTSLKLDLRMNLFKQFKFWIFISEVKLDYHQF